MIKKIPFVFLFSCLVACTPYTEKLIQKADSLAQKKQFERSFVHGNKFSIYTQMRLNPGDKQAVVYIEGDGRPWLSRTYPSKNPTPKEPMGLYFAAADNKYNSVIYLARPCQFMMSGTDPSCELKYWTSHRYSEEVVEAYDELLYILREQHQIERFHLVGFSGGAAIAVLVAARRDDIVSLRTVAGNLDTVGFTFIHRVAPTVESLNPVDVALKIQNLPQIHFIGSNDTYVPRDLVDAFLSEMKSPNCAGVKVKPAGHIDGWLEMWPSLLHEPLPCETLTPT